MISESKSDSRFSNLFCVSRDTPTPGGFPSTNSSSPDWETETTALDRSNGTTTPKPDKLLLVSSWLMLSIALAGLAGNAAVLWLLGFRMRRNAFSVYVLNLAAADFFFLCVSVVLSHFSLFSTSVPHFLTSVWNFFYLTGLSIISAISTERCLSVLWPIWYRCHRPRRLSAAICALLWALSLVLSFLEGYSCGFLFSDWEPSTCRSFEFLAAAWLILLFLILSVSSLALLFRILCGSQRFPLNRLYVTVLLTALVFLLFGMPDGIHWYLLFWIAGFYNNSHAYFNQVTQVLSCVNSSANPIIYFFVGSFRQRRRGQTLKQVLQRALQDAPEMGESGSGLPQGTPEMSGSSLL
nr:mas-related G-protein coupled receptor member X2-like [Oryctolagus cuniculus]